MIFILLGVIIGFVIGFCDDGFLLGIAGSIMGLISGLLLFLMVGGIIGCGLDTKEIVEEQELCALKDAASIEGQKYLFSGYINERLVCRYIVNTEKGKHIEELNTEKVYINEGDYKPVVKTHNIQLAKDWYYWFAHEAFVDGYYVEFFVPEGTLTTEYNIDLQ